MKPILFNTEMVKAIVAGRKTMTRRLIKPQPKSPVVKHLREWQETVPSAGGHIRVFPPPFKPGEVRYVRETWAKMADLGTISQAGYVYRADFSDNELQELAEKHFHWRPSIHMPKEAARLFIRIKSVRVEQLQAITDEDAIKEGVPDEWPMDAVYCPICKGELAGLFADWDAGGYLAKVLELLKPARPVNIPDFPAIIKEAMEYDSDVLCRYCPSIDCRECVVAEWKED